MTHSPAGRSTPSRRLIKPLAVLAITAGLTCTALPAATAAETPAATRSSSATMFTSSTAPTVTQDPQDVTVDSGNGVSFDASATNEDFAQWQVSTGGGASYTNIDGENANQLDLTTTSYAMNGNKYRVAYSNTTDTTYTAPASLTVIASAINVTTQPQSVDSTTMGQEVSFTAQATSDPAPSIQWQVTKNDGASFTDIPGATSETYTTTASSNADSGWGYQAVFTNPGGSTTSDTAWESVIPSAPVVTKSPSSVGVEAGDPATFTADATGDPAPDVTWEYSTDGGKNYQSIDGATSKTLTLTPVKADSGNKYRAVFTNVADQRRTSAATLTVTGTVPGKPTGVTAKQTGPGQVTMGWVAPTNPGSRPITGYDAGYSAGQWGNGENDPASARGTVFKHLAPGSYTFSVAAVNAAGESVRVFVPVKVVAAARPLTLTTSRTSMTDGQSVTVGGNGTPGAKVTLDRALPGGAFTTFGTYTVGPNGTWGATVKLAHTSTFRARAGAHVTPTRHVSVAFQVTMTATRTGVRTYTLAGRVAPARSGEAVTVSYKRGDGSYAVLNRVRTSSTGAWSMRVRMGQTRTYTFAATAAASTLNAAGSVHRDVAVR